jgi:hypothetical protein
MQNFRFRLPPVFQLMTRFKPEAFNVLQNSFGDRILNDSGSFLWRYSPDFQMSSVPGFRGIRGEAHWPHPT